MSIDETLLTLAQELAEEYDPALDTSSGSSFRTAFLDPLLRRAGGSPLDVDLETFLVERLQTEIDDVDVGSFSAMRDLVIRAFVAMSAPMQREVNGVKLTQSLNNYQVMTRAELNALLGNYFTALQDGLKATGTVRMYFPSPQSVTVTPATQFSTGSGLNFFPTVVQTISSTQMSFQQSGGLYFLDVLVQAESSGDAYNVASGAISSVVGIGSVTRVENRGRFSNALNEETKEEGVARTQNSITIRNLITSRGAAFVIPESFPQVDTLQVIGRGDPEMLRDVVNGPTEISGIPGGISGRDELDLSMGEFIHIGGMTDIYAYQAEPDEEDIDLENLTDKGFRVFAGKHGFTAAGTPTSTLEDEYGFFQKRGVVAGDLLLVGEDVFTIAAVSTEFALDITPDTLDGGQFELTYEIVRKAAGRVTVPLYDLVAVDSSGSVVLAPSGNPVAPIPGSPTNEELLTSIGTQFEKLENISTENVELPLLRVTSVEFLDPLTKEALGQVIPMLDLALARAPSAFTGGTVSTSATGTVRLYFRDAVRCYTSSATNFISADGRTFVVSPVATGSGAEVLAAGSDITVVGADVTGTVAVGDNFILSTGVAAGQYTIVSLSFAAGDTTITVREALPISASSNYFVYPGVLEANMSQDTATGLYFFDVSVADVLTGTDGNKPEGEVFEAFEVSSEGWSLKSTSSVLSYSTRDLPYLQITDWVNDTTELGVTFTAPAVRISYEYAGSLADIQTFADDTANRVVSEDVLLRHFIPAYVRTSMTVEGLTADSSKGAVVAYINALDPSDDLEVSDVVNDQYQLGANHVVLPVTLTALTQNRNRTWTAAFSEDTLGSSRIQHFIADESAIVITGD